MGCLSEKRQRIAMATGGASRKCLCSPTRGSQSHIPTLMCSLSWRAYTSKKQRVMELIHIIAKVEVVVEAIR